MEKIMEKNILLDLALCTMKITRGYETFSAESIAEIHFVLEVSFFLILRKQEAEMKEWYQISTEDVKKKMETSEHGLTTEEAAKRLAQYGENVLVEGKKKSVLKVFFGQFVDLLVGILIVAAVISACSGNPESTFVILVVIVLNALLGTVQYVKAEKSLESLKDLTSPNAKVLRSGVKVEIPAKEVVPGDLLLLEAGDMVAADGRIRRSYSLQVNESSLTGESTNVEKREGVIEQHRRWQSYLPAVPADS